MIDFKEYLKELLNLELILVTIALILFLITRKKDVSYWFDTTLISFLAFLIIILIITLIITFIAKSPKFPQRKNIDNTS